ncbi:MAG: Hsp33 family molecular chaperone HslO [Betaproteobacteria bacterium]
MSDRLLKFLLSDAPVRGEVVRLAEVWQQVIEHHDYPAPVLALLGQMTAAAALLAANSKFNGALSRQIEGDGPVRLLVVECQPDFRLRATAKLRADAPVPADATLRTLVNAQGQGRCAITLDPQDRQPGQQPYQGIVSLTGDSIAHALESYMRQSEQLDTRLWLAADARAASGVLLQKLPAEGGRAAQARDTDAWDRTTTLAGTLTPPELLDNDTEQLVRKLFWQERLEHGAAFAPRFECRCSRGRIGRMLLSLGRGEVEDILREQDRVEVTCDFCNQVQSFDAVDVGQLFATGDSRNEVPERRH